MNIKKFYVFDFDGVVCDSTNECLITSYNAYNKYSNKTKNKLRNELKEFDEDEIRIFRKLRPMARGAFDYYIIYELLKKMKYNKIDDKIIIKYKKKLNKHKSNFVKIFYQERNRLKKKSLNKWIKFHYIYNDVIKVLKKLRKENKLLIATLKDAKSVKNILSKYNIEIGKNIILSEKEIGSKLEALNKFQTKLNLKKKDLVFFDDNVYHLIDPKKNNFNVYLTAWGPTSSSYLKLAKDHSINVLKDINTFKFI